jgi:peroxiredoxin Q/BCP
MAISIGSKAPSFKLPSTEGKDVSLASLKGQRFVLYFYPKDDTPGCTREACDFRDNLARVTSAGARVYGVSKDPMSAHDKFRSKYELPFPLLSDEGNAVAREYGAYGKKMMYGKAVEGTIRSTFVIGPDGKVEHLWSPVKVDGHVDKVLAALRGEAAEAKAAPKKAAAKKTPAKKPAAKKAKGKK